MFDDIEESLGSYGDPTELPKHVVTIEQHTAGSRFNYVYVVRCNVCGQLARPYDNVKDAQNRKSTHDRGQDAGAD